MFLNGQAIASPGPHGEEVEDDSFVLLFNAHAEDREFKLPRRRMGARWELELCTADPTAEPGSAPMTPQELINVIAHSITILRRVAEVSRCRASLRATYRLQLTPEFGFAAARARIPYLRDLGISHLYLSPSLQARAGSTHGYDVVDPTRISDDLGGEAAFRALADAAHEAGLGIVLDLVPNHMATDDANRFWADPELRERFFDIDPATGRHRRFFDIDDLAGRAPGGPGGVRGDPRAGAGAGARGRRRRAAHRPSRRAGRPGAVLRAAARRAAPRRSGSRRSSKPSEPLRDWPVSGTVGYEFLNDVCALFVDPAREPAFTALWQELSGDRRPFAEVARRGQARAGHRHRSRPRCERLARGADVPGGAEALARGGGVVPDLPHLRRAGGGRRRRGRPSSGGRRAACRADCRADAAAGARRPRPSSSPAFSRRPRRWWPRASRTPRSTATRGCWRLTTSAATPAGSGSAPSLPRGQRRAGAAVPRRRC